MSPDQSLLDHGDALPPSRQLDWIEAVALSTHAAAVNIFTMPFGKNNLNFIVATFLFN
jgi:hypothetical protein